MAKALRAVRGALWGLGAFSCAINLLLLAPAIYMLQIYDRVLGSRNEVTLYMLTLILVGLLGLEALLELARSKILIRAGSALDVTLAPRVFDASFERHLAARTGNPAAPLGDLALVRQFLNGKGLLAFFDAPWTPVYLLVIFLLSPWLGLFALVSAILLVALAFVNERATGPALVRAATIAHGAGNYALGSLRNAEVIAAHGMLATLRARWLARHSHSLALQASASERGANMAAATKFLRTVLQSTILGLGALLVLDNQMSAGGMIAASILLGRALSPVDLLIASWRTLVPAREAYRRLGQLLASHPAPAQSTALPRPRGEVAIDGLVVAPPGSRDPILKGIQLHAPAGSVVAVVGPSAAGKSTLARALVGVWPPLHGSVRLDGADVSRWRKDELGPWVGYLPQDVELFDGTIAENIARFGELDSAKIVAAARKAGVHEMVLRLPHGYDTPIGENGIALSAGQRQRVALARALFGDPALIVLDEPNANLDEAGDEALLAALGQLKNEKRTVFVMTHRPNVLAVADSLVVLAGGTLRAQGPRDSVVKGLPFRAGRALAGEAA
ncbi:MAG TPA: type I secretion system permease/ATPase [Burkholderiales bacterium]